MSLTDAACRNALCPADKARVRLTDSGGLYLEVTPNRSKRWFWKYLFDGKEKRIALGHYAEVGSTSVRVSLKEAREARDEARKLQRGGTDPAQHRQLEKLIKQVTAGATFEVVARELHATKSGAWGPRYFERWIERMEKDLFPWISSLPMLMQEEIERLIMTGELAVGSRINESELAQRFNTSRGPIREALRALEEADEIYELREALEEIIGRRVARAMTPDALKRLKAMLAPMKAAAQAQGVEQYAQLNLQFHDTLLDIAGSQKLTETYKRLTKELLLFRMRALDSGGGLRVSVDEHRAIIEAIASGDPDRAGAAMRRHVAESRARMHRALGRNDAATGIPPTTTSPIKEA